MKTATKFAPGTRMTLEEHEALLAKMTPQERAIHDWYEQFDREYRDKLQHNISITSSVIKAIKGCDVRQLAHDLEHAIRLRVWEDLPMGITQARHRKVEHFTFLQWCDQVLFTSPDELMRIMSGHLPDANVAGEAAMAVIDQVKAEEPEMLKVLMHQAPGTNLPGWRQLVDSKAKECNGMWTKCATHLSDITAGKVGNHGKRNPDGTFTNAAPDAALDDATKGADRKPKCERERQRIRFRGLKDDPAKCAELGITTAGAQAAYEIMCANNTIPLTEVGRIAGFKETPRKRIELSGALTPAQASTKLLAFYGDEWAVRLVTELSVLLTK